MKRHNELMPFYAGIMDDFFGSKWAPMDDGRKIPAMNIQEDEENLLLELKVPGLKKEDITVNYENGYLTISGHCSKETSSKKYLRQEFASCSFERSIELPENRYKVNEAAASYNDGILEIRMPKYEHCTNTIKHIAVE